MSKPTGTFIAIESPLADYAAAQAKRLQSRLESAGFEVAYFAFPQSGEPSSYFADRYNNGSYGLAAATAPYAGSLFFALDHFEAGPAIRQALEKGKVVIAHKYLGANMVERGAKLQYAVERRGYFMWLDNLESQVLSAPRPDKTFVLAVSRSQAQAIEAEKPGSVSVETQATLYSELCDLYPKDFIRIDTERNGKALDETVLQDMLWGLVETLLPVKEQPVTPITPAEINILPLADAATPTCVIQVSVSQLLLSQIQGYLPHAPYNHSRSLPSQNISAAYILPPYFNDGLRTSYSDVLNQLQIDYRAIKQGLEKHLKSTGVKPGQAAQLAQAILPVAGLSQLSLQLTDPELEALMVGLLSNELPEAWELGQKLLKAARQYNQTFDIKAAEIAGNASRQRTMRKLAKALSRVHAMGQDTPVVLTSVSPRNEFDLLPHMLYEQSDMAFNDIEREVQKWPFEQKQAAFEAYLDPQTDRHEPGSALAAAHYCWDMLTPFRSLQLVQAADSSQLTLQHLTPRFGFDVPELIETAGLTDLYQDCFDRSMQLYSDLQQAGYELEAQYVTLLGHKQRWSFMCNGQQLARIVRVLSSDVIQNWYLKLLEERHPQFTSSLKRKLADEL